MTQYIQIFALIPVVIVAIIFFCHWLVLGFTSCDSLLDWLMYLIVSIVCAGILLKINRIFWQWVKFQKEIDSPTPSRVEQKQAETPPTTNNSAPVNGESRGFDWSKQKQGTPEAASAYKSSIECRENSEKLRTLDQLIIDVKKIGVN